MGLPDITVIIPVKPGGELRVLSALGAMDYPRERMQVIVAEGRAPSVQRNTAARRATGEIIFFLDDDSLPPPTHFREVVKRFADPKVCAVGGPILTPDTDTFLQKGFGLALSSVFGGASVRARYKRLGPERDATENDLILANLSFRREVFVGEGGFNESLYPNEENELINRLQAKGYTFRYVPDCAIYRSQRQSYRAYLKQVFTYGRGRMDQNYAHPEGFKPLHLAPSAFLLYFLSLAFFHNIIYILPLLLYLTLSLGLSALAASEGKSPLHFLVMPWLFLSLHLGYGAGFLWGFFKGLGHGGKVPRAVSEVFVREVDPKAL